MARTPVPYTTCPYCEGFLPLVWWTESRGYHIKYPHPRLLCICGWWREVIKTLPQNLAAHRARELAGVFDVTRQQPG